MRDSSSASQAASRVAVSRSQPAIPVDDYLVIGEFLYWLREEIPSTKLRGRAIKEKYPEIDKLDTTLRSNSLRLWKTLDGEGAQAFLGVLGVNDIRDYYTSNPTVIIRDHRKKLRQVNVT